MNRSYSELFNSLVQANIRNQELESSLKQRVIPNTTNQGCDVTDKSNLVTAFSTYPYIHMSSTCYDERIKLEDKN
jgi:hypothetical protein